MSQYLRAFLPGGTFFFTVVTHERRPIFRSECARRLLSSAAVETRGAAPFETVAHVILPDHLHCIWTLPEGDGDFSSRWSRLKRLFTKAWTTEGGSEASVSASRQRHREKGVWQRGFWEHMIRDETDLIRHVEYIHFNPVKHGLVDCPHAWPHSSFGRWVRAGWCAGEWQCACHRKSLIHPDFKELEATAME